MNRIILYILSIFFTTGTLIAQKAENSLIKKAMKDELHRNMKELSYKDYSKPFYISYSIADIKSATITATLGAILSNDTQNYKSKNVRLMMGDYQVNDENFEDPNNIAAYNIGEISMPVDNDYWGIRRSLWLSTDAVYKAAAESYNNKLNALKEQNLNTDDLPLPDFTKADIVKIDIKEVENNFDHHIFSKKTKDLSAKFIDYKELTSSQVSFANFTADVFYLNSEGIETRVPVSVSMINIFATLMNGSDFHFDQLSYYASTPNDLPDNDAIEKDIELMTESLLKLRDEAETFDDTYSGPVLFYDQAVAELFVNSIKNGYNNFVSVRKPLYNRPQMSLYAGKNSNPFARKIGKKIMSENLSFTALPGLDTFNSQKLIGSFIIDGEGIKPKDSVSVVIDGKLQTLFNSRTPSDEIAFSNGHNRYAILPGAIYKQLGAGVLEIKAKETLSRENLKAELIKKAKEEGQDYAIIVKKIIPGMFSNPTLIFKVDLETGEETLLKSLRLKSFASNILKKIGGVSDHQMVYNFMATSSYGGMQGGGLSGLPTSYILPDAILINEMDIESITRPMSVKEFTVPNPLKNLKK